MTSDRKPAAPVDGAAHDLARDLPKLSIAIPTYNRAEILRRQLGSLIGQIVACQEDVEIVVSDNASSDTTERVVDEMRCHFSGLRYVRNDENLGLLRNVDCAVRACRAEYVWIVSDDDVLMPYAVETVLAAVSRAWNENDRPTFILLSAFPLATDNSWVGPQWKPVLSESELVPNAGIVFLSCDYVVLGLISLYVVRRLDWTVRPYQIDGPWIAYGFIKHLMLVSKNRPAYFVSTPIIGARNMRSRAYANHLPMSLCIEFPSYDAMLLHEWKISRREIARLQRRRWQTTLRALVKINLFTEYAPYWPLVDAALVLTAEGRAARFWSRALLRNRPWSDRIRRFFEPRMVQAISADTGLHELV
jgi:glycosyltransferase involved in cell wall biosynthesis